MLRQSNDKPQLIRQLALFGVIPILMAVGPLVGFVDRQIARRLARHGTILDGSVHSDWDLRLPAKKSMI